MKIDIEFDKKFAKIVDHTEIKDLQSKVIIQLSKNIYEVFNKFVLEKKNKQEVIVRVNGEIVDNFSNIKNALCYCIFDRRGKYVEAKRISQLDKFLYSVELNIQIHKKLFVKAKSLEEKLIYLAKLNEDKLKRSNMLHELDNFMSESTYWQNKQYQLKTE